MKTRLPYSLFFLLLSGLWACASPPKEKIPSPAPCPAARHTPAEDPQSKQARPFAFVGDFAFPEITRFVRVRTVEPFGIPGRWQSFPSRLGTDPVTRRLERTGFVPRAGKAPFQWEVHPFGLSVSADDRTFAFLDLPARLEGERVYADLSRLTLAQVAQFVELHPDVREFSLSLSGTRQMEPIRPIRDRVIALHLQEAVDNLEMLDSWPRLAALSMRVARPPRGRIHLTELSHLEIEMVPGARFTPGDILLALGADPHRLHTLEIRGSIDASTLEAVSAFRQLVRLQLDGLGHRVPDLSPLSHLCRLRDLDISGGDGLFARGSETASRLHLEVLSLRSFTAKTGELALLPETLGALRLEGPLTAENLAGISRLTRLNTLSLRTRGRLAPVLDLSALAKLPLTQLELQGDFAMNGDTAPGLVHTLQWIVGENTRHLPLDRFGQLTHLDLTLTAPDVQIIWPTRQRLRTLRWRDHAETPTPVSWEHLQQALSPEALVLDLATAALPWPATGFQWPDTLEELSLVHSGVDDSIFTEPALSRLRRLWLAGAAVTRKGAEKPGHTNLSRLTLFDTAGAPGETLVWLRPVNRGRIP